MKTISEKSNIIETELLEHNKTISLLHKKINEIEILSEKIIDTHNKKNKLLICGNGGSSADAQHLSSELVGKFEKKRNSLAAISLSTDTSALTAIGNDFGFENIFSRQVEGLGQKGDLLIVISTSGNSENLVNAVNSANNQDIYSIGLLGNKGGILKDIVDFNITIDSHKTCRIQEAHGLIIHILCKLIDEKFS